MEDLVLLGLVRMRGRAVDVGEAMSVEQGGAKETAQFLLRAIDRFGSREGRVLDFGCGAGRLVAELDALGLDVYGCDFQKNLGQSERLQPIETPYRLPYLDEQVSVVVSTSVLEHAQNTEEFFREIHRVLRPGGIAMHIYPGKWYLPTEPHIYVPLANWLWPRCPRWWLNLWAILGVRNEFQGSKPWREVAAINADFCRDGLSYWTTGQYRDLSMRVFGNCSWPMTFYVDNSPGGVARLGRGLRLPSLVGLLSRETRMAFLVNTR